MCFWPGMVKWKNFKTLLNSHAFIMQLTWYIEALSQPYIIVIFVQVTVWYAEYIPDLNLW
jgi:hypothetical protein